MFHSWTIIWPPLDHLRHTTTSLNSITSDHIGRQLFRLVLPYDQLRLSRSHYEVHKTSLCRINDLSAFTCNYTEGGNGLRGRERKRERERERAEGQSNFQWPRDKEGKPLALGIYTGGFISSITFNRISFDQTPTSDSLAVFCYFTSNWLSFLFFLFNRSIGRDPRILRKRNSFFLFSFLFVCFCSLNALTM